MKKLESVTWLAWAEIAARLLRTKSETSTTSVSSSSVMPIGLPSSIGPSGSKSRVRSELLAGLPRHRHLALDLVAVHRRLEHPQAGQVGGHHLLGAAADLVDLDVIGMAVVAVPVVDGQHVGPLLAQDRRQPLSGLVDVGLPERLLVEVRLPAGHPRVGVAQPHEPVDAQCRRRALGLGTAPIGERLAVGEIVGHLAVLAVGRHDEHDPVPLGVGARHRPAGGDRLVVGMGVEHDQRAHHACLTAPAAIRAVDPFGRDAPVEQHLAGVLAVVRRRPRQLGHACG